MRLGVAVVVALGLLATATARADPVVEVDGSGPATAQLLAVSGNGDAACSGVMFVQACASVALLGDATGMVAATGFGDAACQGPVPLVRTCAAVATVGTASGAVAVSGVGSAYGCQDHLYLTL